MSTDQLGLANVTYPVPVYDTTAIMESRGLSKLLDELESEREHAEPETDS